MKNNKKTNKWKKPKNWKMGKKYQKLKRYILKRDSSINPNYIDKLWIKVNKEI